MKELKFRAWDKNESELISIKSFGFLENGEVWYIQAIDEKEREIDPPYFTGEDNLVVMQYTGLKSKKDIEIYEGDVIRLELHQDFFVDFHEGCFVAKSTNNVQRVNWLPSTLWELVEMGYEVIGNIYENPEFLNG